VFFVHSPFYIAQHHARNKRLSDIVGLAFGNGSQTVPGRLVAFERWRIIKLGFTHQSRLLWRSKLFSRATIMPLLYQRGNTCGKLSRISYSIGTPPVIIRLLEDEGPLRLTLHRRVLGCVGVFLASSLCLLPFVALIWLWRTFKFSLLRTPDQGVGPMPSSGHVLLYWRKNTSLSFRIASLVNQFTPGPNKKTISGVAAVWSWRSGKVNSWYSAWRSVFGTCGSA